MSLLDRVLEVIDREDLSEGQHISTLLESLEALEDGESSDEEDGDE